MSRLIKQFKDYLEGKKHSIVSNKKTISGKLLRGRISTFVSNLRAKGPVVYLIFGFGFLALVVSVFIFFSFLNKNQASASGETVGFVGSSGSGLETVSNPGVTVNISSILSTNVNINYSVSGGVLGSDYSLNGGTGSSSGSVTIVAGQKSVGIPIKIINNSKVESNKVLVISLSSVSGASLGSNSIYTYTVLDDDSSNTNLTGSDPDSLPSFDYTGINSLKVTDGLKLKLDASSFSGVGDQYYNNTSLLLHGDGSNGATNTVDNSVNNSSIAFNGDASISTAQSKFGGSSFKFDGSGDYLSLGENSGFGYGSGDFTIEFWLNLTNNNNQSIVSNLTTASSLAPHLYYNGSGNNIRYYTGGGDRIIGSSLTPLTWNHIALSRSSGVTKMFINGVQSGSSYSDTNDYGNSNPFIAGDYGSPAGNADSLNGYLDDVRITKGVARYTSNFTAPGAAFLNQSGSLSDGTSLSAWSDDSGNGNNATQATTASQPVLKTGVLNGKNVVRFDGSDDYLRIPDGPSIKPTNQISSFIVHKFNTTNTVSLSNTEAGGYEYLYDSSNNLNTYIRRNGAYAQITAPQAVNQFYLNNTTYDGKVTSLYSNGKLSSTNDAGANYPIQYVNNSTIIGAEAGTGTNADGYYLNGDIAEVLVYNRSLNDSERKQVECYLSNKYGLALKSCTNAIQLKLDASSISGNDGSSVASWTDTSGNNNNATQATTASQPVLKTGTNGINGRNVVKFDGVDDVLTLPNVLNFASQQASEFVVLDNKSNTKQWVAMETGSSGTDGYWGTNSQFSYNGYWSEFRGTRLESLPSPSTELRPKLYTTVSGTGTGNYKVFTDGSLKATANPSWGVSSAPKIGSGYGTAKNFQGNIAEILVYDRALSDFERTQVECYLGKKYNLSVSACATNTNKLWLDASTISGSDGSSVSSWNDISGNGNNATQSTTAQQPVLKTGVLNGKNVVRFDGTKILSTSAIDLSNTTSASLFLVDKSTTNAVSIENSTNTNNSTTGFGLYQNDTSCGSLCSTQAGTDVNIKGDVGYSQAYFPGLSTNNQVISGILNKSLSNNESKLFINGVQNTQLATNSNNTNNFGSNSFFIGNRSGGTSGGLAGDIPEILIFNTALSNSQRSLIETYLGNKYGITISNNKYALSSSTSGSLTGIGAEGDGLSLLSGSSGGLYLADNGINSDGKYILSSVGSGEYLMAGNDGATGLSTSDLGSTGVSKRWNRVWGIDKTATDGINGKISFDFSEYKGGVPSSSNLANYKLLYRSSGSGNFSVVTTSGNASLDSGDRISFGVDDANLLDGYYTLGTTSEASNPLSLPDSVSDLSVVSGNKQVTLNWSVPSGSSGISDYVIQYSSDNFVNEVLTFDDGVSTNTSSVVVNNLESNTRYAFRVIATNKSGSGTYSNSVDTTTSGGSPSISSLSPSNGPTTGGNTVTINGSNFGKSGYKKVITLTNSGSALTNYEASLTLDTQSLISTGKMRQDCGDIRFSDSDNFTGLQYWIESGCNTTSTIVWVRIPSTPAGTKTISLIYGNSSLSSNSDLSNFSFAGVIGTSTPKALWLKASDGTGQTVDGSPVSTWLDKSGNAYDASQPTTTNQPVLKTGVLNGKSVVRFDGADDYLTSGYYVPAGDKTMFIAWKFNSLTGTNSSGLSGTQQVNAYLYTGFDNSTSPVKSYSAYGNGTVITGSRTLSANSKYLFTLRGGSTANFYLNGNLDGSGSGASTSAATVPYLIGRLSSSQAYYTNEDIAEILIYNSSLNDTDRSKVETYLNNKYSLYGNQLTFSTGSEQNLVTISVTFSVNNATNVTILNASQINVVAPANSTPGVVTLTLTLDSNTMTISYEYKAPAITSVSPNSGPTTGGTNITINGSNFVQPEIYKPVTITNSGSSLSDYQIKMSLDTQSLITAGKMRSDCGDLRVKDTDKTTDLPYWIESGCNTTSTVVWTKVASIPVGTKTLYFNYNKPATTSQSNGNNVFAFFDDFSDGTVDNTKWTTVDTSSYISQNNKIIVSGGLNSWTSTGMYSNSNFNRADGLAFEFDFKPISANYAMLGWKDTSTSVNYTIFPHTVYNNNLQNLIYENNSNKGDTSKPWVYGQQYRVREYMLPAGGATYQRSTDNGQTWDTLLTTSGITNTPVKLGFTSYNGLMEFDNAVVRKFTTTEPTLSYGSEVYSINSVPTTGLLQVTFNGVATKNILVLSSSQITATSPAGTAGSAIVRVVNPDGVDSANGGNNTFSYLSPIVSSVSPNTGSTLAGTNITINGSNFVQPEIYKPVTITNSGSSLSDYQIKMSLDTQSLITAGKMRSDCGDLRVKDTDKTTDLPYWIESGCNTTSTVVWTKVATVNTGTKIVYLYYSNRSLSSQSNKANVFIFSDDFSGTNIDSTKWTKVDTAANYITQNDKIIVSGANTGSWTSVGMYSNANYSRYDGLAFEFDFKPYSGNFSMLGWKDTSTSVNYSIFPHAIYSNISQTDDVYENNSNQGDSGKNWTANQQYKIRIFIKPTGGAVYQRSLDNGITWEAWFTTNSTSSTPLKIGFTNNTAGFEMDNVVIRKFSITDPTLSYGSENYTINSVPVSGITQVTINNLPASNVVYISSTKITATTPAGSVGVANVKVINPDGVDSGTTGNGLFTYSAPIVSSVAPASGATTGGGNITINGSYFAYNGLSKPITINNSGNVITGAEVNVTVDTQSLITAGKMRSDCGDLRIKDNNNSANLSYWLEYGCNTLFTSIWIKVPTLNTGSNTVYLNYSNGLTSGNSSISFFSFGSALGSSANQVWLKADEGTSTTTDGAALTSWTNKTGNGINANASTAPTFKTNIVNGKPIIRFASTTRLDLSSAVGLATGSVFTVAKGGGSTLLSGGTGSFQYRITTSGQTLTRSCVVEVSGSTTNSIYGTQFNTTNLNYSNPAGSFYLNGQLDTSFSNAQSFGAVQYIGQNGCNGNNEAFTGDLAELIIFNLPVANSDRTAVESYLNTKYRLYSAASLPTTSVGAELSGLKVQIGSNYATNVQLISSTQITATTPAGSVGTYPLKVVAPDGVESNTNITYTYAAPVVNSISPSFGPNSGGTFVTISGSNFGNAGNRFVRTIQINNPGSSLSNYENYTLLDTKTLISDGKIRSDCGDIRVKDTNNTDLFGSTDNTNLLSYWVEGCNTPATAIWFKITTFNNGLRNIYLSYGNTSLTSIASLSSFSFGSALSSNNNKLWFAASDISSSNGSTISSITNKANPSNNLLVQSGYSGTTYVTSGIGGRPSINFANTGAQSYQFVSQIADIRSVFWVLNEKNTGGFLLGDTSAYNFHRNGAGLWNGSYASSNVLNGNTYLNSQQITPSTNAQLSLNTPTIVSLVTTGNVVASTLAKDRTYNSGFMGDVSELIIFNSALSNTDRQYIENYLNLKYKIFNTSGIITPTLSSEQTINVKVGNASMSNVTFLSSQTLTGYVPAGTGSVSITVTNSDGSSGTSSSPLYTYGTNNVPNPVNDLNITSTEGGNVGLSWSAPFDNGSSISDYVIKYSSDNFVNDIHTFNDGVSTVNSTLVSGLTPGQSYQFKVISSNSSNVNGGNGLNNSLDSNIVSVSKLDCDTDLAGADLIIATNQVLTGRYCNVNLFQVNSGITATLNNTPGTGSSGGTVVKVYASSGNVAGSISGNSTGYAGTLGNTGNGIGAGTGSGCYSYATGAGYGGAGGTSGSVAGGVAYGSISQPLDLGSSGGASCAGNGPSGVGGGAIKLFVTNTLTVNGSISANGGDGSTFTAGGSGGSVWLQSNVLAGSGTISTNGGNRGTYTTGIAGGGGGRIALYYATKSFSGTVSNTGGSGSQNGGAGTIYEKPASLSYGNLRIDQNNVSTSSANTPINSTNFSLDTLDSLVVTNKSVASLDKDLTILNTGTFDINTGTSFTQNSPLTFNNNLSTLSVAGTLTSNANILVPGITTFNIDGTVSLSTYSFPTITTLNINATGTLTHKANSTTTATPVYKLDLSIGDLNIASGGKIDAGAKGYAGTLGNTGNGIGAGTGSGCYSYATGAGYGGAGGTSGSVAGGVAYGSISQPLDLGSSGGASCAGNGPSGVGGGAIKLFVTNTLTVNGSISANGGDGSTFTAGGSGGSVWLQSNVLAGSGTISTNGGNRGTYTTGIAGGGGGRIALYYATKSFSGTVSNTGGSGSQNGGAGTIYEKPASLSYGNLRIDQNNVSTSSANTPINSTNFSLDTLDSLVVTNKSVASLDKDLTILNTGTFDINTGTSFTQNSPLTFNNNLSTLSVAGTLTSNANILVPGITTFNIDGTVSLSTYSFPTITTLNINATGTLTHKANSTTTATPVYKLDLSIGDLNIASGGKIDAGAKGYAGTLGNTGNGIGAGTGSGCYSYATGAGYGGAGGTSGSVAGGVAYGSISQPLDLGSSGGASCAGNGPSGVGGGAIKLFVTNTLTVNGSISANGGDGSTFTAGGSGGSVWLQSNVLAGSGTISTNGGNRGTYTTGIAGGGGGRIALYYQNRTGSLTQGTSTSSITVNGGSGNGDCNEVLTGSNPSAYTNNTSGCTGTIYDPNTPETNLSSATLTTNPNPVSQGSAFAASVTNVKNTFGFSLFSGTCSVSITGPGNFSSAVVRSGTVASGVCTLASSFPAPDTAGSFSSSASVTGNGNTQNATIPFTVYAPASGRALADTTFTTQPKSPYYLLPSPTINLIGAGGPSLSASGFIDSGNNQALNGVVCTFLVTGPNSYSQTFASSPMIGGSCSYTFSAFELPSALLTSSGNYSVNVSVPGVDSGNNNVTLTTTSATFNRFYDIYLELAGNPGTYNNLGTIPGASTSTPSTIALGNNAIISSPVIKKYNNSSLITTPLACVNTVEINNNSSPIVKTYTSTINPSGQCVTTLPSADLSSGTLRTKTSITLVLNSQNLVFQTNYTTIPTTGFPSNLAKYNSSPTVSTPELQPIYNTGASNIVSASPSFVGSSITLTVSGLIDSANNLPLGANSVGPVCSFLITRPDLSTTSVNSPAASSGSCAVTVSNTELGISGGSFSFRMSLSGKDNLNNDATLTTPSVSFARRYDVNLTGANGLTGNLPGAVSTTPNPILATQNSTVTSPTFKKFDGATNLSSSTPCRIVFRYINGSTSTQTITTYDGTLNGNSQCTATIPASSVPVAGNSYIKARVALFGSALSSSSSDVFETGESQVLVKNPNTSKICSPVFRDDNSNKIWDTTSLNGQQNQLGLDEPYLLGVNLKLLDNTLTPISGKTLTTALPTSGNPNINCFSSLFDDTYYLELTLPAGTTLTTPDSTNLPGGVTLIRDGQNVITGLRYRIVLGVNDAQTFTTGLNGNSRICTAGSFVDLDGNGSLNGSDYKLTKPTRLYLSSNLTTPVNTLTTSTTAPICFTSLPPSAYDSSSVSYVVEQDVPPSSDPDFLAGGQLTTLSQSISGYGTISLAQQVSNTKARTGGITLTNGQDFNGLVFGYKRLASYKAKAQGSPNQTKAISTGNNFAAVVNSSEVSGKIYARYKFNTRFTGLIDSATGGALTIPNTQPNFASACSVTFSGPSFNSPQQAYGTITNGTCLVDPIPDNSGNGNTAEMTVDGDNGTLGSTGNFDVLDGKVNICSATFADYSGDANRQGSEPYLAGRTLKLFNNATNTEVQASILSTTSGNDCFSNVTPGITYRLEETAFSGNTPTTNSGSSIYTFTPDPEVNQNFKFGYRGNSTICPLAFRDDSGDGIKNTNAYGDSEPYVSGVFTATLLDNLNNQVGSFSINNSGCFTNLLSGDYTLSQSYASGLKVGRTNFSSGSTTINSLGVGQSVSREFGYQNQATICPNPTFSDYNKNGVQDSGEPVINSLPVKLIRVSGSTQIGSDLILTGSNCFTGTIPDTYQVVETKPVGGSLTTSASSGVSSYSQTSTTATALITTTLGVDLNTPFGYKGNATICPYPTFRDVNKNGAKDSGETDIDGVSTSLKDGAGTVISTILTNAGTSTCFTELLAGSYRLIQVSPQNTSSTTGGVDKAVDNLGAGETRSVAFGYNGDPRICPITFRDDNSNLIYDNGEITLSGVTVTLKDFSGATTLNTLTTSTSSSNCFTGLTAGTYLVQVSNLNNYSLTTVSSRSVTVNFGDSLSPQFGYNGSGTICVNPTFKDSNSSGSFDSGETYFTGVNTYLKYPSGSLVTPLQATNSSGATCFTGVAPGSYVVAQDAPSGSTSTTGGAQSVSLAPSETKTLAFGYNGSGTICANPTFDDANFDGAKNTAENYLSGVNTKLYLLPDTTNVFKSATTNSLGTACFVGLFPGNYTISQDLPSGYTSGSSTTGGSQTFALTSSQYKTVAFGYTTNPDYILGAIRGFLYIDRNENGVYNPNGQDAAQITVFDNDIPVTKAEVQLLKKNTTTNLYEFVSSTLSVSDPNNPESDGTYAFTALNPGDYKVVIVTPQGTSPVSPNPPERLVTITGSQKVVAQDFGFQYTAKICPALFVDKNKNNIFDTGDVDLIATRGAYYQLSYQSYNGSQVASNYNTYGYLINSANPCIEKVPPRDYTLIFRSDLAGLLNYSSSFDNSFYNQVTPNQSLTIYLGNQVNTSNRYYTNFVPNYTNSIIQGRVWHNRPPNNSFDGNGYDDQTGISGGRDYSYDDDFAYSGVNMSLKKCGVGFGEVQADVDSWNNSMPTSVTDANGYYTFPTVPPGTYAVIRNTTLPSEAALNGLPVNDCSYPSNYLFINNTYQYGGGYAPGSTITYDIVLSYKASINSTLYIDQNHNGVYDSFETNGPNGGLVGGTLTLTNSVGNVVAVQDSNSSNYAPPYGSSFPQVPPDNYTVSLSERVNTISNYDSYYSLVEYPSSCPTGYSQLGGTDLRFEFDYTYDSNNRSGRFCIKDSEFSSFNFVDYATGSCPTGYSQLGGTDLRFEFDYTYDSNNRSGRMCVKDSELSKFSFVDYATGSCPTGYSQLNNTDTRMEFDYTYDSNNRSGRFCIQTSIQRTETFTYPLLPADQAPKTVNVTTATDATNLSYGFNPTNNSVISGKVFVDRNNNNIYQPSGADNSSSTTFDNDTPIANSTIQLYYGAILDPVASKFVASTTSDSSGDYSFSGLSEGYYSARITTAAPAGTNCTRCDWGYNSFRTDLVYVGKDSTSTQNLRYNYNGSLTFKAFHDTIVNSVRDGIELDASGMKFTVTSTDGYTLGTSDPNPCCTHSFDNLPPGTYSVNINNIPAGISLTGGYSTTDSLSVLASENYTRDYPFTPYTNNIIQGYIFVDRNLNGVLEVNGVDNAANTFDDEKPFGLATVRITGPLGTYSTTTNSSGFYQFTGLSTGNYKLHTTGVEPDVDLNDPLASQVVARCFTALDCKSPYGDGDGQISFSWSGGQLASSTVTRGVNLYAASTVTNNFSYEYTNTLNARCIDDLNGDGSITTYADTGYTEGPINGCSFRITTPTGEYLTFSAGSNISASRLPPGSYTITKLSNVSGRTNTNTFRRDITPNINLGDQSSVTQTFTAAAGFYQKGYYNFMQFAQPITNNSAITGKTYIDKAQDSLYQANGIDGNPLTLEDNDILLPNISIALTGTTPVGTITRSTSTNIDGKYQFTDLPRGSFTVVAGVGS